MLGAIVNMHVANELATEAVLGKHTLHNFDKQGVITGFEMLVE